MNNLPKELKKEFDKVYNELENLDKYVDNDKIDKVNLRNDINNLREDFNRLEDKAKDFVTKERFGLTEKLALGAASLILIGFMGVVINFFIRQQ